MLSKKLELIDGELLEAMVMREVDHPNILKVVDWYCDGIGAFIVMPYSGYFIDLRTIKDQTQYL